MRSRRSTTEHQEAVSRRLALLSQELSSLGPPLPPERGPSSVLPVSVEAAVPVVRAAGRHAARRPAAASLASSLAGGRVALGPSQLAVVAVVVAVGLAVTAWWVARGEPAAVATPTEAPAPLASAGPPSALATPVGDAAAGPPSPASSEEVTVDVAGKVRRPGIVVLAPGARVVDALEAAGGARPGADLRGLNLARVLVDGEQVLVGVPLPTGATGSLGLSPPSATGSAPLVDLNSAAQAELESLPEVGPVTAQAIIAWRSEHGGFTAVDQLLDVDGIGEATLAAVAPLVTV